MQSTTIRHAVRLSDELPKKNPMHWLVQRILYLEYLLASFISLRKLERLNASPSIEIVDVLFDP